MLCGTLVNLLRCEREIQSLLITIVAFLAGPQPESFCRPSYVVDSESLLALVQQNEVVILHETPHSYTV